ncbi:hypothetical protein LTR17_004590 [Elasticomyces elasticus]|nr:hypothetical protein LTR17_004590 [Elasticomyces elasticus]
MFTSRLLVLHPPTGNDTASVHQHHKNLCIPPTTFYALSPAKRQEDQQTKHDVVEMADQLPHRPNPNTIQPATPTDQDRIQTLTEELARKDKIIEDLEAMKQAYAKIITSLQHAGVQRDEVIEQAAGIHTLLESNIESLKEKMQTQGERIELLKQIIQVQEADGVKRIELLKQIVQVQKERIEELTA